MKDPDKTNLNSLEKELSTKVLRCYFFGLMFIFFILYIFNHYYLIISIPAAIILLKKAPKKTTHIYLKLN